MKRKGLSALLVLLLMLLIPVTASADVIYPAPAPFVVGVEVNHLLATLDPGSTVWANPDLLPDGLYVEAEESEQCVNVYLRGVPTTPGTYNLVIRYNNNANLCSVTIEPNNDLDAVPVGLSVETPPIVTEYSEGEELDPDGLSLKVELSDNSHYLVTEGYTLSPTQLKMPGTQTIEVSYEGLSCSFDVDVAAVPEVIQRIAVEQKPDKLEYTVGEELDDSGLVVRVFTNKGERYAFPQELVCFPTSLTDPGRQEITVYYGDKTCSFKVNVLSPASTPKPSATPKPAASVSPTPEPSRVPADPSPTPSVEPSPSPSPAPSPEPTATPEPSQAPEPTETPGAEITETPAPEPSPSLQPSPSPEPDTEPIVPTASRPETADQRSQDVQPGQGKKILAVTGIAALATLAVIGIYVFYVNRNARESFSVFFKDLFRKKR